MKRKPKCRHREKDSRRSQRCADLEDYKTPYDETHQAALAYSVFVFAAAAIIVELVVAIIPLPCLVQRPAQTCVRLHVRNSGRRVYLSDQSKHDDTSTMAVILPKAYVGKCNTQHMYRVQTLVLNL